MLKIFFGAILGAVAGVSGVYVHHCLDFKFDFNHATNFTIAAATLFAVLIHFDAQRTARNNRVWDVNKEILLDLVHSLSKAMSATRLEIENELKHQSGADSVDSVKRESASFDNLDRKVDYVLSVYSPLMESNLIADIKKFKSESDEITRRVFEYEASNLEAYEEMLKKYESLYVKLINFVGRISGIKYT